MSAAISSADAPPASGEDAARVDATSSQQDRRDAQAASVPAGVISERSIRSSEQIWSGSTSELFASSHSDLFADSGFLSGRSASELMALLRQRDPSELNDPFNEFETVGDGGDNALSTRSTRGGSSAELNSGFSSDSDSTNDSGESGSSSDSAAVYVEPAPAIEIEELVFSSDTDSISLAQGNVSVTWDALEGTARVEGGFNQFSAVSAEARLTIDYGWAAGPVELSFEQSYSLIYDNNVGELIGFDIFDAGWTNVLGSDYNDSLMGSQAAVNELSGASGDDLIISLGSGNTLSGGSGNDTLFMGLGDFVVGGAGRDLFIFSNGQDGQRIEDFSLSEDYLLFDSSSQLSRSFSLNLDAIEPQRVEVVDAGSVVAALASGDYDWIAGWDGERGALTLIDGTGTEVALVNMPGLIGLNEQDWALGSGGFFVI